VTTSTLITGARVVDPTQGLDQEADVLVTDGVVESIGAALSPPAGADVVEAGGLLLTPGLVDIHTHFFYGLTSMAVDPRSAFAGRGITAAVDAGTSGASNFMNFKTFILEPSKYRLFGFLNVDVLGFAGGPGGSRYLKTHSPLERALVEPAAKIIERNRDRLVGVKVMAPSAGSDTVGLTADLVGRAAEIARLSGTRVICHIDGGEPLATILDILRPGDIVTHFLQGKAPNILGDGGAVVPEVRAARERGVLFDFAPADSHHFSWTVLEGAAADGFWPDSLSTDTANPMKGDPPFATMPDCMSMFLHAGMPMSQVVRAATAGPAAAIGKEDLLGSLAPGRAADISLMRLEDSPKTYRSMREGEERTVARRLVPVATMVGGEWLWSSEGVRPLVASA
jgi:dihydroorotase